MKHKKELPDDIIALIVGEHYGQTSEGDSRQLADFLLVHPEYHESVEEYRNLLNDLSKLKQIDQKKAWESVSDATIYCHLKPVKRAIYLRWYAIAAVLIPLIIVTGLLFLRQNSGPASIEEQYAELLSSSRQSRASLILSTGEVLHLDESSTGKSFEKEGVRILQDENDRITYGEASTVSIHTLVTPRAGEYQLVLSDGTKVWINADSSLEFPTAFRGNERRVRLSGEAYFEVDADPDRPFVISTSAMDVVVTGTTLNICHYPGEEATTTLVEGSLYIFDQEQQQLYLRPGQQAIVTETSPQAIVKNVNTESYTSWVTGMLVFQGMTLKDLAKRMERWYDVEVQFNDTLSQNIRFSGAMNKNKPVSFLISLIEESSDITFSFTDNKLLVSTPGNKH